MRASNAFNILRILLFEWGYDPVSGAHLVTSRELNCIIHHLVPKPGTMPKELAKEVVSEEKQKLIKPCYCAPVQRGTWFNLFIILGVAFDF